MSLNRLLMLSIGFAWLTGCSTEPSHSSRQNSDENSVPYYTARELKTALAEHTNPVLVEFSVPVGCSRCDTMRPQVNELADYKPNDIEVLRVNFNHDRVLANQLGVTVCPTYIAFEDGQELFRIAYPTSGDLIASELQRIRPDVSASTTQTE